MTIFGRLFRKPREVEKGTEPPLRAPRNRPSRRGLDEARAWAARQTESPSANVFTTPKPAPGVVPTGMAMDEASGSSEWAYAGIAAAGGGVVGWLGYPVLTELALRPEYRKISETIATEVTRKWIKIQSAGGDKDKSEKISKIDDEFDRLKVRDVFRAASMADSEFGRAHIFLDFGADPNDTVELGTPIGDGYDNASRNKVGQGSLKALRTIEPMWTYPSRYNSTNPLDPTWYKPQAWYVMGREVHASRFLTIVSREVPDIFKPAYQFGGLSMTQIAKPYVDNWLRTRQSVSDLVHSFTINGLKTDLSQVLQTGMGANALSAEYAGQASSGTDIATRVAVFNGARDNHGTLIIDKDSEEFFNITTPLGSLDALQAQSQEQMASITAIPLVILLGITPTGLNASSEGEHKAWENRVHAYQEANFKDPLHRLLGYVQLSLFGQVDPDITFRFLPLHELTAKEEADLRKVNADTGAVLIQNSVILPMEERARVAADEDSPYASLDVDALPINAGEEDEQMTAEALS